jgi:hypothetical protein
MITTLMFAALLSVQDDVWKSLKLGDRVQVVFRSGSMITGQLTPKPGDPRVKVTAVDYTRLDAITLDVTLEYPGLNGTLSIPKKEIKEIRKLQNLDPATMKRLQEELRKVQEAALADELARKASEGERDQKAKAAAAAGQKESEATAGASAQGGEIVKQAERLKQGLELLARFPPPEWGEHRISEITGKALRKQPISVLEKEFADNIGLWKDAFSYQEKQKAGEKKEKAPENK